LQRSEFWFKHHVGKRFQPKKKHRVLKISTDAQILISTTPVPPYVLVLIRENLNSDSNVTEESNRHSAQDSLSKSLSDERQKAARRPQEATEKSDSDVREHLWCDHPQNVWDFSKFRAVRDLSGGG
jgi:hypothetical protein